MIKTNALGRIREFIERQTENFKVLLISSVVTNSHRNLTLGQAAASGGGGAGGASYQQLFLRTLGADSQQIGYLNSLNRVANAVFALPLGWLSDRFSQRKVNLFGLLLGIIVPITFLLATDWSQAIPAMVIDAVATTMLGIFVTIFYINAVKETSDRATAMSLRNTLISIVGLAVPTLSAIVVSHFGGITVEGIRPLFIIQIVVGASVFLYAFFKLKEVAFLQKKEIEQKKSIFQDYKEIARIPVVQKWTVTKCLRMFFANSLLPFYSLFYVEVKQANEITIAAMGTVATLGVLIFLVPLGRLADKYGRKKVIYLTRPFNYLSIFVAILAPSPEYLIVAAFLGALNSVSFLMEITMEHELVPEQQRGRWGGFLFFIMGLTGIPGPILTGYLWQRLNPAYLLLLPILADIPFIAVLPTIPDTLKIEHKKEA